MNKLRKLHGFRFNFYSNYGVRIFWMEMKMNTNNSIPDELVSRPIDNRVIRPVSPLCYIVNNKIDE